MGAKEQGADAATGRWLVIPRTLCFVLNGDDVLLMKRAAHKRVFPGRYNGVGGHIERDEDPLTSARREILEETGLHVQNLRLRGVCHIDANEPVGVIVLVFTATSEHRDTQDNGEGSLHWVCRNQVLDLDLVDDLPVILPHLLTMEPDAPPFFVHVSYDKTNDTIRLRLADD